MPKPSSDENQPEQDSKSARLGQDITDLHKEVRQDFDQRIFDLTALMAKFKSLMINDIRSQPQQKDISQATTGSRQTTQPLEKPAAKPVPVITRKIAINQPAPKPAGQSTRPITHHRARFETGLYQLNSQLQRFRLELDQELEFRQQPLHVHFRQQSELAKTLQEISLSNSEKENK